MRRPIPPIAVPALVLLALLPATSLAEAQVTEYRIVPERSSIYAVTGRAGALGFLGHDHAILALEWSGRICYAPDDPSASSARFTVDASALALDTDEAVRVANTPSRPGADTRSDLQQQMLGPEYLDVDAFPEIRFETRDVSVGDEGVEEDLVLQGTFRLHGNTREVRVPVRVSRNVDGTWRFRADLTTPMTAFGIEPESTLGVIDVADDFDVHADIVARAGDAPCP